MAAKRMTANPIKPARYRPGKAVAEEPSSEEDESEEEEEEQQQQPTRTAPPPKATSFPSDATKIAGNLKKVDLNERRKQAAVEEAERVKAEELARVAAEEEFETEESEEGASGDADSESGSGSESGAEESSSEDEAPKKLLRPTFLKKDKRKDNTTPPVAPAEDEQWVEEEARRKEKADAMIQEQLEKNAAAQAAGKKDWDDDEVIEVELVDDTDGLDPDAERAAWKLRELKRVKREREAIEEAEKEKEEIERRRNLSKEEREAEDKEFLKAQKEDREDKGKMGYMQKYFHKGAFFQDDAKTEGLDRRDIMGSRYADDVSNRELLPEYMQIRDMTKLGRKGRTKYKDLKSEDTGKWGTFDHRGPRKADGSLDERFLPDRDFGGKGASGANTTQNKNQEETMRASETLLENHIRAHGHRRGDEGNVLTRDHHLVGTGGRTLTQGLLRPEEIDIEMTRTGGSEVHLHIKIDTKEISDDE
ncbi:hypothetical protein ACLMJK_000914 [Lecanora helva]